MPLSERTKNLLLAPFAIYAVLFVVYCPLLLVDGVRRNLNKTK